MKVIYMCIRCGIDSPEWSKLQGKQCVLNGSAPHEHMVRVKVIDSEVKR